MLVSFVLRMRSEDLERGRFTGRIEHVASGYQQAFRDFDEVAAFCRQVAAAPTDIPAPRGRGTPDGIGST